jgi:A1 cistron-splicing factor AAR2
MEGQRAVHALDAEQRNALAAQGATLLLLGVPPGTTIGIDFTSYSAGDKFAGLKMIPPGLHFLSHCAAAASDRAEAPIKAGFWFVASLGGVLVRRWDAAAEEFAPEGAVDAEELERFAAAVRRHEFDAATGPYPYDSHGDWRTLTEHLTIHALKRHQPDPGAAVAGTDLEGFDPHDEVLRADPRLMEAALARAADRAPPVTFSDVGDRPRPRPGAANPLDRSHELAELHSALPAAVPGAAASSRVGPRAAAVLAEMELAFALFMLISSWTAFEQWKKLVVLLCSCDASLTDDPSSEPLFLAFLRLFRAQLAYTPRELFTDELAKDNFLQLALSVRCRQPPSRA